jgi:REP element-mobilizing transposase RayT
MSFEKSITVAHSYTNLLYHIVFATLERGCLISGEFASRLHQYLGGIVRGLGGISLGVNGAEEHIHMLAKLHQDLAVSEFVEKVKSNSSGWAENVLAGGG